MDQKLEMPLNSTLLVGFDFTHGKDKSLLIVGKRSGKMIEVLNAFAGGDAEVMYELLTTPASKN